MPLGKLGAFGKTNALEAGQGLLRQYQSGLIAGEEAKKDRLLADLKIREDRRAEAEANRKTAEYNRRTEMLSFDDVAKKSGLPPQVIKMMKEEYSMRGLLDDKSMIRRMDLTDNYVDVTKSLGGKADLILDSMIDQQTNDIANIDERLSKETNQAKRIALNAERKIAEQKRSKLYSQKPSIATEAAKERAKQGVKAEDEKYRAEVDKIKSEAEKNRAAARKADRGEGGKAKMTPANAKQIGDAAYTAIVGQMDLDTRDALAAERMKKPATGWLALQQEYPQVYTYTRRVTEKAKEIFMRDHPTSVQDAVMDAIDEVNDERKQEEYEVRFGAASRPEPNKTSYTAMQATAQTGVDVSVPTPDTSFELTKSKLTLRSPYKYKDEKGQEHTSKDLLKTYYKPPKGFTEEDAKDLAIEIDKARENGISMNDIVLKLQQIGFTLAFE